MYGRANPGFPGHSTFHNHFGSKQATLDHLREWVASRPDFADVAAFLGPRAVGPNLKPAREARPVDGFVYLIRSGEHHKIGRTDNIERRFKEITIALPAAATIEHHIRTDDPAGIEAYWHRRFADRRAKGEWFKLTAVDIAAFKRRSFQ
jgi:AcrR family transcriptional regulator